MNLPLVLLILFIFVIQTYSTEYTLFVTPNEKYIQTTAIHRNEISCTQKDKPCTFAIAIRELNKLKLDDSAIVTFLDGKYIFSSTTQLPDITSPTSLTFIGSSKVNFLSQFFNESFFNINIDCPTSPTSTIKFSDFNFFNTEDKYIVKTKANSTCNFNLVFEHVNIQNSLFLLSYHSQVTSLHLNHVNLRNCSRIFGSLTPYSLYITTLKPLKMDIKVQNCVFNDVSKIYISNEGSLSMTIWGTSLINSRGGFSIVSKDSQVVAIEESRFENNFATPLHVIAWKNLDLNIRNNIVTKNYAGKHDVGTLVFQSTIGSIKSSFKNNYLERNFVERMGNVFYLLGVNYGTFNINHYNNTFKSNWNGGGLTILKNSVLGSDKINSYLTINQDIYINNTVLIRTEHSSGGAVYVMSPDNTNIVITNSRFENNSAGDQGGYFLPSYGGALSFTNMDFRSKLNVHVNNSFFKHNRASHAGVIHFRGENLDVVVKNSTFTHNKALMEDCPSCFFESGGVLHIESESSNENKKRIAPPVISKKVLFEDCFFSNNIATFGGVFDIPMSSIAINFNVNRCYFLLNQAFIWGGVFHGYHTHLSIVESNFTMNKAGFFSSEEDEEAFGGALFVSNSWTRISKSIFNLNMAEFEGGAVYSSEDKLLEIRESHFLDNFGNLAGGTFSVYSIEVFMLLDHSTIKGSVAEYGGAIMFEQEEEFTKGTLLDETIVISNNLACSGGGLYFVNEIPNFHPETVYNNEAYNGNNFLGYPTYYKINDTKENTCDLISESALLDVYNCDIESVMFYDSFDEWVFSPVYTDIFYIIDLGEWEYQFTSGNTSSIKFAHTVTKLLQGLVLANFTFLNVTKSVKFYFELPKSPVIYWHWILISVVAVITFLLLLVVLGIILTLSCKKRKRRLNHSQFFEEYVKIKENN